MAEAAIGRVMRKTKLEWATDIMGFVVAALTLALIFTAREAVLVADAICCIFLVVFLIVLREQTPPEGVKQPKDHEKI